MKSLEIWQEAKTERKSSKMDSETVHKFGFTALIMYHLFYLFALIGVF